MFLLPAFLTTVLFSISAVSATRIARIWGGIAANFWRITIAVGLLAAWAHTAGAGWSGVAFPMFLLSGLVGFGIGDLALYQALPRIGSRLSILLVHCVAAPFAALIEWLWLGTQLTMNQIAWSAVILVGVAVALAPEKNLNTTRSLLAAGTLFGLLAALGQGSGAVLSRKAYALAASAGEEIDGLSAAYQRILAGWAVAGIAALIAWQHSRLREQRQPGPPGTTQTMQQKWRVTWHWMGVNALCGPTLGVGCYQWALSQTPTGIVLPIVALTPLVVIPFARVIEGEKPSWRSLAGGAIGVAGAVALARIS